MNEVQEAPPLCKCHGVPKVWRKKKNLLAGGCWICPILAREHAVRYRAAHRTRVREQQARWRADNPDKIRENHAISNAENNHRRIMVGPMYLGMSGFTREERAALLNG